MGNACWEHLAQEQHGMVARRQLRGLGISRHTEASQVRAGRWARRSATVISTFTGSLTFTQRCWLGVLHAGGPALVGALSAAKLRGLQRWERDEVTIMVPDNVVLEPLSGIRWVRTRRDLDRLRAIGHRLPVMQTAPALLMFAAVERSERTAIGALAAGVQQHVTSPDDLTRWLERLAPIRRARLFRSAIASFAGGAQSLAEIDVGAICARFGLAQPDRQVRRLDASGRWRYQDCEWQRPDWRIIVLEVDGSFHMEAEQWQKDLERSRDLADPTRTAIRCTAQELRTDPAAIAATLARLGVPAAGRVSQRAT